MNINIECGRCVGTELCLLSWGMRRQSQQKEAVKWSTVEREIRLSASEGKSIVWGKKQMNSCKTLGINSRRGIIFSTKEGQLTKEKGK